MFTQLTFRVTSDSCGFIFMFFIKSVTDPFLHVSTLQRTRCTDTQSLKYITKSDADGLYTSTLGSCSNNLTTYIWILLFKRLLFLCALCRTAGAWLRNAPSPCLLTGCPRRSWPPSSAVTTVKAASGPVGIMPTSNRRTSCITVSWERGKTPLTPIAPA